MDPRELDQVLARLSTADSEAAWSAFLEDYARLILQVVHLFERDADRSADCFVFVCERLNEKDSRRLRRFRRDGPASFATWLRAVVRNLCLDWIRAQRGRPRGRSRLARLLWSPARIPALAAVRVEDCVPLGPPGHGGEVPDPRLDPEAQAVATEARVALGRALLRLSDAERLLIRLRFEEELTLDQVARLSGLRGPQGASRRIDEVLERLRKAIQEG